MLKKINRSLSKSDFDLSKKSGVMYQNPLFGVSVVKKSDGDLQFGFVISKRISKKAVVRNRVRRILSDSVKENLFILKMSANFVFLVKTAILNVKPEEIKKEVKNIFEKLQ